MGWLISLIIYGFWVNHVKPIFFTFKYIQFYFMFNSFFHWFFIVSFIVYLVEIILPISLRKYMFQMLPISLKKWRVIEKLIRNYYCVNFFANICLILIHSLLSISFHWVYETHILILSIYYIISYFIKLELPESKMFIGKRMEYYFWHGVIICCTSKKSCIRNCK